MKKRISILLSALLALGSVSMTACKGGAGAQGDDSNVLRVASWDEYIDMGGEDSYYYEEGQSLPRPLYVEFEDWYEETYGKSIRVEYVALQDNETMYSKIKMGDRYDLLCPSEYMIMKLVAEDKLQPLPDSFFDTSAEHNYFARNLSPYIRDIFDNGKLKNGSSWSKYAAGYMWGTTGFVFNTDNIEEDGVMDSWSALKNKACQRKITTKDNVRDNYFAGLAMYYESLIADGKLTQAELLANKDTYMNDTSPATMGKVKEHLIDMRSNLYGLETDEGKLEIVAERLDASYQWSGDAVYILDEAEDAGVNLEYRIPKSVSNLWFDGWVMMKTENAEKIQMATAFINFLSKPENVIRNMAYIGYTSCIATDEVFAYVKDEYGDEEGDVRYDLDYFFGEGEHAFQTSEAQTRKQLFAQYPTRETIDRLVVMDYIDAETNERANRMWINIK